MIKKQSINLNGMVKIEPEEAKDLSINSAKEFIVAESNRCVSCGLCLPHCPTYRLLKSETDSPRGRIALMQGVMKDKIPLNERFVMHMDRCLTCRACESVCPNHVAFGRLMDAARSVITQQSSDPLQNKKADILFMLKQYFIMQPMRIERLRRLFYWLQQMGLLQWLGKLELLEKNVIARLVGQLPLVEFPVSTVTTTSYKVGTRWQEVYPAKGQERGAVGLFLGCITRLTDVITLNASIFILNQLGYVVHVPSRQTCCGAIHQHAGDLDSAMVLARQNRSAFTELGLDVVLSTASGCGVQLVEEGNADRYRVMDISQFLLTAQGWENIELKPLEQKVLIHDPCSLRHVLSGHGFVYELMARIPGAQIVSLPGNDQCCGAAGVYFINQSEIAQQLLDAKLSAVQEAGAAYLLTSNIGCAMHLAAGLRGKGIDLEVLHPVTLLARQMGLEL